jgi:hypothetical protein
VRRHASTANQRVLELAHGTGVAAEPNAGRRFPARPGGGSGGSGRSTGSTSGYSFFTCFRRKNYNGIYSGPLRLVKNVRWSTREIKPKMRDGRAKKCTVVEPCLFIWASGAATEIQ